jgi:hypothetical protein
VVKKISIFCDITPCSPLTVTWRFRGIYYHYFQGWRVSEIRNQHKVGILVRTDVSEEPIASIFRVEKSSREEPAWAGGCRQSHQSTGGIAFPHLEAISSRIYFNRLDPLGRDLGWKKLPCAQISSSRLHQRISWSATNSHASNQLIKQNIIVGGYKLCSPLQFFRKWLLLPSSAE